MTAAEPPTRWPPLVVAIDGPSGSGKSTVSRLVAVRLGVAYLDTGAMYRALTWWCRQQDVPLADKDAVAQACVSLPLQVGLDPHDPYTIVAGKRIDVEIRTTEVSESVSTVATNLAVRPQMRERQRALIALAPVGIVVEGRDITTVVAPDATVRILLLAEESARLSRRAKELHGHADEAALIATRDQVVRRDAQDSMVSSFLHAAPGVVSIDTSRLDLAGAVETVLDVVERATGRRPPAPARAVELEDRR